MQQQFIHRGLAVFLFSLTYIGCWWLSLTTTVHGLKFFSMLVVVIETIPLSIFLGMYFYYAAVCSDIETFSEFLRRVV